MSRSLLTFSVIVTTLVLFACGSPSPAQTTITQSPTTLVTTLAPSTPAPSASNRMKADLENCASSEPNKLHDIKDGPGAPYFVHHPAQNDTMNGTIIFIPGGRGSRGSAQRVWSNFLSEGKGVDAYRVVIPYSVDIDFIDDAARTWTIMDAVFECFGGDTSKIHVAGTSNGGLVAFALMQSRPEKFASLLGAPGAFPRMIPKDYTNALFGKAVFNGVGANDFDWKPDVMEIHEALLAAGIDSVYVEFPGESHIVSEEFDESIFFEFWMRH